MRVIIATNQILELLELARQGRAQQANISQKTETCLWIRILRKVC